MQKRRVPDKGILLFALWICVCSAHGLQESEQRVFLRSGQKHPGIQQAALSICQRETLLPSAKNCESVRPKASQIFSGDEKDGVMPFLYHEEMVDCGSPERSASWYSVQPRASRV